MTRRISSPNFDTLTSPNPKIERNATGVVGLWIVSSARV